MEYMMTPTNFYTAIAQLSGWLFIVASMLALLANFVLVPRLASVTADASNNSKKSY